MMRSETAAHRRAITRTLAVLFGVISGVAFAGETALIDDAIADMPDLHPVLGTAEQGRWLASVHPQVLALETNMRGRGIQALTSPGTGVRFAVDLPERG